LSKWISSLSSVGTGNTREDFQKTMPIFK
jgi:hypothetical protein